MGSNPFALNVQFFLKLELETVPHDFDITFTKMDKLKVFIVNLVFIVLSSVHSFGKTPSTNDKK